MAEQNNLDLSQQGQENINDYKFEPIKGHQVLHWRGKRSFTSTQFYPAQLKEEFGSDISGSRMVEKEDVSECIDIEEPIVGWKNKIYWGDNLQVLSHLLKSHRKGIDFIYIDPPFDSGADYRKKIKVKGKKHEGNVSSFEEKQYTDIWNNDEYLQFMYERLILLRELLSNSGTIAVHCDQSKGHLLRCLMDEVFGENNFLNEVIWDYRRWPTPSKEYQKMHDNIYLYCRNKGNHRFIKQYMPRSEETEKRWKGQSIVASHDADGNRIPSENSQEESKGSPLNSVWYVPIVAPSGHERVGYPTQKPEALIEKLILGSTLPGDLVLDCFMGSGTTLSVATKLGRRFIGADINLAAIQITTKRLVKVNSALEHDLINSVQKFTGFQVFNVNHYDVFRNPIQAKELLIDALEIQKLESASIYDGEKDNRMVKIMPVNRITTKADLNELINGFNYKVWERRQNENPGKPVEKLRLICMGHEPDLKAQLELEAKPFKIDVEVMDILRDKSKLEFKYDSEAQTEIINGEFLVSKFYPMNLLQKLSIQKEAVSEWRELVESIMIDWNYDGAIFQPTIVDVPDKNDFVIGRYKIPSDAGTIRIKITDLLSESWEGNING